MPTQPFQKISAPCNWSGRTSFAINEAKPVFEPGPHQVLCRVEVAASAFPI